VVTEAFKTIGAIDSFQAMCRYSIIAVKALVVVDVEISANRRGEGRACVDVATSR